MPVAIQQSLTGQILPDFRGLHLAFPMNFLWVFQATEITPISKHLLYPLSVADSPVLDLYTALDFP